MRIGADTGVKLSAPPASPVAEWRLPESSLLLPDRIEGAGWMRGLAWSFLALGLAFYLLIVQRADSPMLHITGHAKFFVILAACQAVLMSVLRRMANDVRLGAGLKLLKPAAAAEEAIPVRVEIRQNGALTGADEGLAWLHDGTLFFRGITCVFRLNSQDVVPPADWSRAAQKRQGPALRTLPLSAIPGAEVSLKLIDPFEDYGARRRGAQFQRSVRSWLDRRPEAFIESILPPLDLHPALRRDSSAWQEGAATGLALMMIDLGVAATSQLDFVAGSSIAAVEWAKAAAAITLAAWAGRFGWRAWRDAQVRRAVFLQHQLMPPMP